MKKLIVLLLTFALVGAAFAQTPTLSASSTLSWGWDLDTGYTGFKNKLSATVTIPFAVEDAKKAGETGWWGEIAVTNITFKLTDDALKASSGLGFTDADDDGNPASLSAKITNGIWAVSVDSYSALGYNNAKAIKDGDVNTTALIDANKFGTSVSYNDGTLGFGATAASKDDWTANAANEYALGANASYKVSDALSLSGAAAYDAFDATKDFAGTAKVSFAQGPLSVSVASDLQLVSAKSKFDADALLKISYTVIEGLKTGLDGYYSTLDKDVEAKASVDYAVKPAEAGVAFSLIDPIKTTPPSYELYGYGGYTLAIDPATSLYVRADYKNDLAGAQKLYPYVILTNKSIANTSLNIEYNAGGTDYKGKQDVLAKNYGTLVVWAKITL